MLFQERDLGRLIITLNPHTNGDMMAFAPGDPEVSRRQNEAIRAVADLENIPSDFSTFNLEIEDNPNYQVRWTWVFRGQERILMRAIRIGYRYKVPNGKGALATDYVLVGYEGGGGP